MTIGDALDAFEAEVVESMAITPRTAAIMKVHTSNYMVQGFTAAAPEPELAALAHEQGLPFIVDLGSGMLVNLEDYGLPHEPTPKEAPEELPEEDTDKEEDKEDEDE